MYWFYAFSRTPSGTRNSRGTSTFRLFFFSYCVLHDFISPWQKTTTGNGDQHRDGDHDWDGKKKNCALRPHILGPTNWCMLFWCMTEHQITGLTPMSCCWQCVFVCAAANWQASCSRGYIDALLKKQSPTNENADADLIADIPKKLFWWPHTTACRSLGNACCL